MPDQLSRGWSLRQRLESCYPHQTGSIWNLAFWCCRFGKLDWNSHEIEEGFPVHLLNFPSSRSSRLNVAYLSSSTPNSTHM